MKCHRRECRKAAKFIGSCEEIDGRTTEKFMGAGFFGVEAEQHVSSFDDVPERAAQLGKDVALCVWCICGAYFVRLQEPVLLDVLCVIFFDFRKSLMGV